MLYAGIADPEQLAVMTEALEAHCLVHNINDASHKEYVAQLIVVMFEGGARTVEECWAAYSAKRNWLLAHQSDVEAVVTGWEGFMRSVTLPSPEQFDDVSQASDLPTRAEDLGVSYDDDLLFWALRNSHLLRERISIVDLADLLGVWSDETARSIVAGAAAAG